MDSNSHSITNRIRFTLAIGLFAVMHLTLEFFSGGVNVHYPLMDENLPAISNWWGLLVLPALAWVSYAFMPKADVEAKLLGLQRITLFHLGAAFLYGAALSAGFELNLGQTPLYLLLGLFVAGLFYPLYRLELILGLVMGMTYTFGAVIPLVVSSLVALSSLVLHNALLFALRKIKPQPQ